jgi:U3 small nucleolar RNA-associated protein 20
LTLYFCSLLQQLATDLQSTLLPVYPQIVEQLLKLLTPKILSTSLTSLLATFAAVLKDVLIPSHDLSLLNITWAALRDRLSSILAQSSSEVQRAVAEVWASLLRRSKKDFRSRAIELMLEDLEGDKRLDDLAAWVIVSACSVRFSYHRSLYKS